MVAIMKSASLLTILSMVANLALSQRYPYGYYGYGYYGNQFGCGGRGGWYYATCPDNSITPASCGDTLSCTQFAGYTCISPGICCRQATTSNVCPTGLIANGVLCRNGVCNGAGLVCVNGFCCVGSTTGTCPNGQLGVGTCITFGTGLTCGTGFTCSTVGGQNLCCQNAGATSASSRGRYCENGGSTGRSCFSERNCNNGERCFNGNCCVFRQFRAVSTKTSVCYRPDQSPSGVCSYVGNDTWTGCPAGECNKDKGFCCPPKITADQDDE